MNSLFAVMVLFQVAAAPMRLGDFAQTLTGQDVADLEKLAAAGGSSNPWLLEGPVNAMVPTSLRIYLPAERQAGEFQRGRAIQVMRPRGETAWTVQQTVEYAQLAEPGHPFTEIAGIQDIHKPFPIFGAFTDEEIRSLVKFLRSSPGEVAGGRPIWSISRRQSDVVVTFAPYNNVFQEVTLKLQDSGWIVQGVRNGRA